ncbi:MAG: M3 family oligoendopeptidase [Phycisphaerae bacterium]|nr:M3 family oligoendopeptidase [Phycisphaerae bacterium]
MAHQPFVPNPLDASRWENIEPLGRALLERQVNSPAEFERWLLDRSELDAACAESRAILSIAMTCQTDDPEKAGAYSRYIEEVPPRLRPLAFELDTKQVALHAKFPLDRRRYEVLERSVRTDVELFRAENVPLMTELEQKGQEFQKIAGAMTVQFDGQERTLPQMAPYLQSTDRSVRESAWRGVNDRRLRDKETLDSLFDAMIATRNRVALNAGFENYRDYAFRSMRRFDYTPKHCETFHDAVEKHVVPALCRMSDRRRQNLSLTSLRPWDMSVDEKGRPPLKPFTDGGDLLQRSRRVFARLDPSPGGLNDMFRSLGDNGTPGMCLDLDARKGKAPGGYQEMLHRSRRPFIFMNAASVHSDMETLVHEAGHAFHSLLCRDEPLVAYREAPIEFCEVASMSMQILTMPLWDEYYRSPSDRGRAAKAHYERVITILAWIAQMDAFQHWIYLNPKHTHDERNAHWLHLDARFGPPIDWSGLADARAWQWQRQLHLFLHPFYFIEYGIAQLGALGLWLHSLEKGTASALERYKRAMRLGGSRPLPELFEAAGLPFDFGEATVSRLIGAVETEMAKVQD